MIIPVFNNVSFKYSKIIFDRFVDKYNEKNIKEEDKLKAGHRELFYDLLRMYLDIVIKQRRKYSNATALREIPFPIYTNRLQLRKRLSRNERTLSRYIDRLINAGVITKQFRGTKSNFIIRINHKYLVVFDENKPNNAPKSRYLKSAENEKLKSDNKSIWDDKQKKTRNFNNKLITDENSNVGKK